MRNNLTPAEVNAATLGIDSLQMLQLGHRMEPSSFAHLSERLFKLPVESTTVDGQRIFIANNVMMGIDTAVDFLQCIVGPSKLGKPIRCWLKRGDRWSRITVEHREIVRHVTEYFA